MRKNVLPRRSPLRTSGAPGATEVQLSSLNLRRIARAEILLAVSFEHLVGLLNSEAGVFLVETVKLDLSAAEAVFDFRTLAAVLADPPETFPPALADALHHIHEMSDEDGLELLLDATGSREVRSLVDPSPADVALRMWMLERDVLVRVHAQRLILRTKRYETYRGRPAPLPKLTDAALAPVVERLNRWFDEKKKGSDCVRITHATRGDTTWLMIRHGLAVEQRAEIRQGQTERRVGRPEKYDVVSYVAKRGELSVHTTTKGECDAYRTTLGQVLFGNPEHFADKEKFTFRPLADHGEDALVCDDVEGIDNVTLKEVHFRYGGPDGRETIHRAKRDLFAAWSGILHRPKLDSTALSKVTFLVTFSDSPKKPRTVKIERPHVASYGRDGDEDLVSEWLEKRGFILPVNDDAGA